MNTNRVEDLVSTNHLGDLYRLDGYTALVTGAGSGIGRALAWGFACFGANVAIIDRDLATARASAEALSEGTKRTVIPIGADVSDEKQVVESVVQTRAALGDIDILVNGAGHNIRKPLLEYSQEEFDSLLHVHVRGAFLFCREVGRGMQQRRRGSIINIASILGHIGMANVAAYGAAKGALVQLTKSLALEMAPYGVRVNSLAPGFVDTPLTQQHAAEKRQQYADATPLGRFANVRELIGPAVFLASDASSFVTGTSLVVDGGWTAQ